MLAWGDETADQYILLDVRKDPNFCFLLASRRPTDDFDAVIYGQLSRHGNFAVTAGFSREIDNDRSRFHGFNHLRTDQNYGHLSTTLITNLLCDQLRSWSAGNQSSRNDNVDISTLLHEKFHLRFDELFRHFLCVATLTSTFLLQVHLNEFSAEGLNLLSGRRSRVETSDDSAKTTSL
jgi:hypothetical protein